ncbi:DUF6503 family protein [Pontibacter silvestris]|uniref:DUF6503 family protein n=1 Tax=Pontibacter silvestris TaxID=2305183 RepID=A0ABW4WTT9_9BACT|nr:DUF6503 family protein [Pontibacter silvestris]MCC9138893.1 hypothetical protein [Pontibacter silvestris]
MFSFVSILKYNFSYLIIIVVAFLVACSQEKEPDAHKIIGEAVTAHGGDNYKQGVITFRQGSSIYRLLRHDDAFVYSRTSTDAVGQRVHDVLRNSGFTRTINDIEQELSEKEEQEYSVDLQALVDLVLLPYGLSSAALKKEYLGEALVNEEPYYKVRIVTEGEGKAHREYVCWFHKRRHVLEYVANAIAEDNNGRYFRKAVNAREEGGIRFQDYIDYSAPTSLPLERYDKAFEAGKLESVSEIVLQDIQVGQLPQL